MSLPFSLPSSIFPSETQDTSNTQTSWWQDDASSTASVPLCSNCNSSSLHPNADGYTYCQSCGARQGGITQTLEEEDKLKLAARTKQGRVVRRRKGRNKDGTAEDEEIGREVLDVKDVGYAFQVVLAKFVKLLWAESGESGSFAIVEKEVRKVWFR